MNRNQYANMLRDISITRKNGGDVSTLIAEYRKKYRYVYVYNDSIFKRIFGSPQSKDIAASFLNAVLKLDGGDCIGALDFMDPSIPGGPFVKSITSDIVAKDQYSNRIVIEVQHKGDDEFKDRLVFYTARHTMQNKGPGVDYNLKKLYFIALQMFDTWPDSKNYRHCVQLKNQENEVFFDKQMLTLVEIRKFLRDGYKLDESPLALWLRAIDMINEERDEQRAVETGNPYYTALQKFALLCNSDEEYLLMDAKAMTDREYELSVERKEARAEGRAAGLAEGRAEGALSAKLELAKNMLAENIPISQITRITGLSEKEFLNS